MCLPKCVRSVSVAFFVPLLHLVSSACNRNIPSTSAFYTTTMSDATASFCGDKFIFTYTDGLLVCEKQVQEQTYQVFTQTPYNLSLTEFFAGSLTDACTSKFGVRRTPIALQADLVRATRVSQSGSCLFYAYSLTNVLCVRRTGGVGDVQWEANVLVSQGTLLDVAVYNDYVVRTVHIPNSVSGTDTISLMSRLDNTSEVVVQVSGLVMFAQGEPTFWLRRTADFELYLSKFDVPVNTTFSFNATSTYTKNDVNRIFRKRVPLSSRNTLLECANNFVVFATAKYYQDDVFVYVGVFNSALADMTTYGMQYSVYKIAMDTKAVAISGAYEQIAYVDEATLSATWLADGSFALSVAIPNRETSRYQTVMINVTNLELTYTDMHPDFVRMFAAPFVRVQGAVVSSGALQTCTPCQAAAPGTTVSGYFAYGAATVSYKRLVACDEANRYVEESVVQQLPIQTCARVQPSVTQPDVYVSAVVDISLVCATVDLLEVVLEIRNNSQVSFAQGFVYTASLATRVLLYAHCRKDTPLMFATFYDTATCNGGCAVVFVSGGFRVTGAVVIESVQHRSSVSLASAAWERAMLLAARVKRGVPVPRDVARVWQEHSAIVRTLVPTQKIEIQVLRHVSVEELAAKDGKDTEQSIALDTVTVVPVLSEDLLRVVQGNTSWLTTIVYVPSNSDLRSIALETLAYGDDIGDWSRVHAAVRVVAAETPGAQCMYVARLVAVDDNLQAIDATHATDATTRLNATTGCVFDLALSPQCHIELPRSLTNAASVVGLQIVALTSGCNVLSERSDITVEFAPFMKISQCPAHQFLDADTLACTACDEGELYCPAGKYVQGCLALVHPSRAKTCLLCESPNSSFFSNTSHGCDAWLCVEGYYRSAGLCARCTSALVAGATACYTAPGRRRQACTAFENEQCVDCVTKPRYSEWTVSGSTECAWQCKDAFFASGAGCEVCSTFDEVVATLAFGARAAGAFYRFRPCNGTAQATADKCSARDFGWDLNGTYSADGQTFGEDCALDCAQNSNTHSVRANATRGDFRWIVETCQTCPPESWPVFANGTRLPRQAFRMSESCTSTCLNSQGFFAAPNYTGVCLFCPPAACRNGTFWSSADNCSTCHPCTQKYGGSDFYSAGALDDALSCIEQCPADSYRYDEYTCRPHSLLACTAGLEYAVAGTPLFDAFCGTCADCSGARVAAECTLTSNRQCESCGAIDAWSSFWSRTGCEVMCRTTDGYTKLTTADGVACRKCQACAIGQTRPLTPSNCTCQPCDVGIPAKAIYTKGCTWTCPLYHIARLDAASNSMVCEYTVKQTSNEKYSLRAVSPVTCPRGQRLTQDARPGAYASLLCETCATPAGLLLAQVNVTWRWDRGCAWRCAWNLQKQQTFGLWKCEALVYTHSAIPAVHITRTNSTSSFSWMHVLALALCAVVVVVVALCFFRKMVRRK